MRGSLTEKAPRFGRGLLGVRIPPPQPFSDCVVRDAVKPSCSCVPQLPHLSLKSSHRGPLFPSGLHGTLKAPGLSFGFNSTPALAMDWGFVLPPRKSRSLAVAIGAEETKVAKAMVVVHSIDVIQDKSEGFVIPSRRRATLLTFQVNKPFFDDASFEAASAVLRVSHHHFLERYYFIRPLFTWLFAEVGIGDVFLFESPTKSGDVVAIEEPEAPEDVRIRPRLCHKVNELIPRHGPNRAPLCSFLCHKVTVFEPPLVSNGGSNTFSKWVGSEMVERARLYRFTHSSNSSTLEG